MRLTGGMLVIIIAVLAGVLPMPSRTVERVYSRGLYPALQRVLTPISNAVPFALFDPLLTLVVAALVIRSGIRLRRSSPGRRWRAGAAGLFDLAVTVACAYLVFLVVWGLNYRREPLTRRLEFSAARVSADALAELAQVVVMELNRLHPQAWAHPWPVFAKVPRSLDGGYRGAQRELFPESNAPATAVGGVPKWSALTWYFERSGVDGMTDPFLLEVLVNQRLLPFERPFVVAHEWAHLAGYADESEANFVGWLTCLRADEQAQYSAWLTLYLHVARGLPEDRLAVIGTLDPGPRQDLAAIIKRFRQSNPVVRRAAGEVYDKFLKANRVEAGIDSYDAVVTLILGTRFGPSWAPALRPSS